jgi:hypothetical protein
MITQYKNINAITQSTSAIIAERYPLITKELFKLRGYSYVPEIVQYNNTNRIELHVYSGETWITGNHHTPLVPTTPIVFNESGQQFDFASPPVVIDIETQFQNFNLNAGNYTILVNFFKNLIGSYESPQLKVDEISPDRTELRLRLIDSENQVALTEISNYATTVNQTNITGIAASLSAKTYILNFNRNTTVLFVNSVVVGEYLYVKLLDPLPNSIEENFQCWVVEELKAPYIDKVYIVPQLPVKQFNDLAGPNFDAVGENAISSETGFKTWTDLLGTTLQTSQQIIDSYFSGSLDTVKLNIDYTDFNNFVFYSNATERVKNFKYKLELLELYESQSVAIATVSGSIAATNATDLQVLQTQLIGSFDNFEKFLYYESGSTFYTNSYIPESPVVPQLTGSYIQPAPKSTSLFPYTLYATSTPQFTTWYESLVEFAEQYDLYNLHALSKNIPMHIRYNSNNENMTLFTNMLGHHYDILYTYINNISRLYKHEENPKLGIPNELLYSVAKQFGWNLVNGKQNSNLWEYLYGIPQLDPSNNLYVDDDYISNYFQAPTTASNSVIGDFVPTQDITYTTWRRIVNNLPGLLKSKGTKRSIQALLSCYGIPQSLITIKEYGGPRLDRTPVYEKLNFDYALDLINNAAGTVTINYDVPVNSVELRFRTDNVVKNPQLPNTMHLYTIAGNDITVDFLSGTYGTISINGTASAGMEMFDGGWINTLLRVDGTNLEIIATRAKYGKIVATVSASATASISTPDIVTLGGTSTGASRLQGQLQELRLWSSSLQSEPFNNHTKAPAAYDGNVDAYDELQFRLPLTQKINHSLTASLQGVEPKISGISASFAGWTNNEPYDSVEETYYYDSISLAAGTYDDNKVRIESNDLVGELDLLTRAERSKFDTAPLDSKKIGVYFSPQTMIDEDIIAQLGETYLDEYIGDPGDTELNSYPRLVQFAQQYWKKYSQQNDINAYIKIFSLFDVSFFQQLQQLLPARTDKLTGLLIQPNILERNKDTALPVITPESTTYDIVIDISNDNDVIASEFTEYDAGIDIISTVISADTDADLIGEISQNAALAYNGTAYSYDYVFFSGSAILTGSSPYWFNQSEQPIIINGTPSTVYSVPMIVPVTYGSGIYGVSVYGGNIETLAGSDISDYLPDGLYNLFYNGSSLTSPGFNIDSPDTVDGGPVVEVIDANPNQIVVQPNNNSNGNFVIQ